MFQGVKFQANWAEIWILRKYSVSEICHYLDPPPLLHLPPPALPPLSSLPGIFIPPRSTPLCPSSILIVTIGIICLKRWNFRLTGKKFKFGENIQSVKFITIYCTSPPPPPTCSAPLWSPWRPWIFFSTPPYPLCPACLGISYNTNQKKKCFFWDFFLQKLIDCWLL